MFGFIQHPGSIWCLTLLGITKKEIEDSKLLHRLESRWGEITNTYTIATNSIKRCDKAVIWCQGLEERPTSPEEAAAMSRVTRGNVGSAWA